MILRAMQNNIIKIAKLSVGARPSRELLLIDDQKLRKEMFSATATILKKIKQLEKDHEAFVKWDQRLYEDWYNLTFRHEQEETECLQRRYQALCTFQLHLLYLAEKSSLSLEKAYLLLKEEERQYQNGDEEWRFVIDRLRQHRLEFAQNAKDSLKKKYQAPRADPILGTLFEEAAADHNPQDNQSKVDLTQLNRKSRAIYYYLKEITDESLRKHLASPKEGYELFRKAFHIAMQCGDWPLLARLWLTSGPAFQQKLLKMMPSHLTDFLNQMIAEVQTASRDESKALENEISLKALYRRLARLLHPDTRSGEPPQELHVESQKIWQEVQEAYKIKDLKQLRRLELISLVQLGYLNSLTMDEIYETSLIFAEELEKLKSKLKACRKHPAWKFTSRRTYKSLVEKTREDIRRRQAPLIAEVEHLEKLLNLGP